jgi:dihydrofolate reductase
MIAAASENNALEKQWIGLAFTQRFQKVQELTSGHHIIMGRKTFESFPKPLPNRTHIVISRQDNYKPEGCIVAAAWKSNSYMPHRRSHIHHWWREIYNLGFFSDKIELTRPSRLWSRCFFPEINPSDWEMISEFQPKDDKHLFDYTYQTYVRK